MPRASIGLPEKDKTTIVTSKQLLNMMAIHVAQREGNQTDFITRAIVNQLEREGTLGVREMMHEEGWDI